MISRPVQITIFLLLVGVLAGGIYMNRLKQREERRNQAISGPVAPPSAGTLSPVQLVIAYDDDGVLKNERQNIPLPTEPTARAKHLLRSLISFYAQKPSPHALPEGADVREVFILKDGLCVVDLNLKFAEGHRSGVMVEEMTIASLVASLGQNVPDVTRVKFLVDGKERETLAGHADLGMTYDVATVQTLMAELRIP
jgi:hypothetical protein